MEYIKGMRKRVTGRGGTVWGRTTENIRKSDIMSGGVASVQDVEVGVFMLWEGTTE